MPARIIEYQQQLSPDARAAQSAPYSRPLDVSSGRESAASDLAFAARNIKHAAATLEARDEEEGRAWASDVISGARLQWTQHLIDRQAKAEPGANGFTPGIIKDFDEYADKTIEAAPTNAARNFIRERLLSLRDGIGQSAMEFEAKARVDYRTDKIDGAFDNVAKLMNTDPSQYKVALAEQLAIVDQIAVDPITKSKIKQAGVEKVSAAAVWSQIQKSPQGFLDSIGFGGLPGDVTRKSSGDLTGVTGNAPFDALPFEKRIQLFEGAVRAKAQIDNDAEKAAKAERALLSDNAMKEAWRRMDQGKLTKSYIEAISPLLSPAEYKSLLEARKSGPGGTKTDPGAFRELQNLLYTDPRKAQEFAFRAHRNGQLSNEHLSSALGRARELDRSEGPKSEYERSRQYIVGSLDPGPMVQDPVGRSRLAEALDTFDRWVEAGKGQRTDDEVRTRGREVVDQFKFVDLSQTVIALPHPRSGQIRRNPADLVGMEADIRAAGMKAKQDFESGKLSPIDYQLEIETLNRWRKAVVNAPAPQGTKK